MLNIFNIKIRDAERIASLNKTEAAIVSTLRKAKKPLPLGKLMELLHLTRLVVFYNVRKLEKRGLLTRDATQKAHTWSLSPLFLREGPERKADGNEMAIRDAYKMLNDSLSRKLYGIQGAGAIASIIRMGTRDIDFSKVHRRQKLRQVIIDGILTEQGVALIKDLPYPMLRSHFGRPSELHVIPDNDHISDKEMLSDGKMLVIIDHRRKRATIIENLVVIHGFLSLFESLKRHAIKRKSQDIYGDL